MSSQNFIRNVGRLRPIKNTVFVTDLESGPQLTKAGIIVPDDNMTNSGIRNRWGRVWAIGPDVEGIEPGEWILVLNGRWTLGINLDMEDGMITVWKVEWPEAVLAASKTNPLTRTKTTL